MEKNSGISGKHAYDLFGTITGIPNFMEVTNYGESIVADYKVQLEIMEAKAEHNVQIPLDLTTLKAQEHIRLYNAFLAEELEEFLTEFHNLEQLCFLNRHDPLVEKEYPDLMGSVVKQGMVVSEELADVLHLLVRHSIMLNSTPATLYHKIREVLVNMGVDVADIPSANSPVEDFIPLALFAGDFLNQLSEATPIGQFSKLPNLILSKDYTQNPYCRVILGFRYPYQKTAMQYVTPLVGEIYYRLFNHQRVLKNKPWKKTLRLFHYSESNTRLAILWIAFSKLASVFNITPTLLYQIFWYKCELNKMRASTDEY